MGLFDNVDIPGNISDMAIGKLSKDLREAAANMTRAEARFLVDYYYQMQGDRIRSKNRVRSLKESGEPTDVIMWLSDNTATLERRVASALTPYVQNDFVGRWSMSVTGIGPVISAGLLAHIDIEKAGHVGHILSFAGITPNPRPWGKGEKRPYNARLKLITYHIGECFVKVSNNDKDFYGKFYRRAKDIYIQKNENGEYAGQAKKKLQDFKIGEDTIAYEWYSQGKLPPAHLHARAKRKAVDLFLSHWWEVSYRHRWPERECPKPYAMDVLGHTDYIPIHNNPFA